MSYLWGYNARRGDFHQGIERMVHETVFYAFHAILCPEKGIFYCRPVFLNTEERTRFATGGKASRKRFSNPSVIPYSRATMRLCLPAGGCFAPRHGQAVTLHKAQYLGRFTPPASIPRGAPRRIIPWHHDRAADKKNLVC